MSELAKRLKPLSEEIEDVRRACERRIISLAASERRERDETIARIERNRPVVALLDAAGFQVTPDSYYKGMFNVDLGFFPTTRAATRQLADKVRTVRQILETKLGTPRKHLADEKKGHVEFLLCPPDFPGLTIAYRRRLAPGSKCKIVTQRSTWRRLVCEL